jgi:hypothetical protein
MAKATAPDESVLIEGCRAHSGATMPFAHAVNRMAMVI